MIAQDRYTTSVDYLGTSPDTRPILLSTSAAWIDKRPLKAVQNPNAYPEDSAALEALKKQNWNAFAPQRMTLQALASHVLMGRAWMPAASVRRKVFKSAQALALDFDNDDSGSKAVSIEALKLHPFIARYAAFVYATPSSTPARPKSRVLFVLDETITTAQGYEAAAIALMDLCADLGPDPACKDAARLFFGSKNADHFLNTAAVLPLAVLREHARDMARAAHQKAAAPRLTVITRQAAQDAPHAQKRKHAYAVKGLSNNAAVLASTPKGGGRFGGRNNAFHALLCETLNLAYTLPGTISEVEVIDTLSRAARASGLIESEINQAVQSALKYPREILRSVRADFETAVPRRSGPPNMQRRAQLGQLSARADYSPIGELRYVPLDEYETSASEDAQAIEYAVYTDDVPTLADEDTPPFWADEDAPPMDEPPPFWADDAQDIRAAAPRSEGQAVPNILQYSADIGAAAPLPTDAARGVNQAAAPYSEGMADYPNALPDALIDEGLRLYGKAATIELNYVLSAQARGLLPKTFTLDDVSAARQHDGLTTPLSLRNVYKAMTDYGMLRRATSDELCTDLTGILDRHVCDASLLHDKPMHNSKRGRKQTLYVLVPLSEIKKRMARPAAAALMMLHPEGIPTIEPAQRGRVKRVLDGLLRRKSGITTLSVGLVRGYLADEDKAHAEVVYESIKAIPITDVSLLMDMGLTSQEAAAAAALLFNQDMAALIETKNRIVARLYTERLAALDNPHITPLPETAPRMGDAWLNALRNARAQKHDKALMSAYEMAQLMGVDNVRTAYRIARKAGIQRHERVERRPLDVKRIGDTTPTIDAIRQAIKAACNGGEKAWARRVFSYDERGEVMDIQEAQDIEDLRIGVTFEVEVQLKSQITVESAAPVLAERIKADTSEDAAQDAQAADEAAALVGEQDISRTRRDRQTRLSPECLHSRHWLLARLLAPVCFNAALGVWCNPQTGEIHASAQDVLNDVMGVHPIDAQAAEAVS